MKKKILLVEDEALIALSEAKTLQRNGFEVVTALDGEDAEKKALNDTDISLILMDIDLGGGIDGTTAAEHILKKREIPIVFLTSHSEKEYVDKVKEITRYGYVLKKSGEFVLIEAIHMAYNLFEAHQMSQGYARRLLLTEHESEKRRKYLEATFGSVPVAIVTGDHQGRVVEWNKEAERLFGYTPAEAIGENVDSLIASNSEEENSTALEITNQVLNKEGIQNVEKVRYRKDGSLIFVALSVAPIIQDGNVIGAVASYKDITDRKKTDEYLKRSEENLRITLNSIGDAVVSTDIVGNVVHMNPVAEHLTGWKSADAIGLPLEDVFHIVNTYTHETVVNPVKRVLKNGETVGLANHTMLISKDGTEYQIADSAAPIRDTEGQINGVVLVFRDVTKQYRNNRLLQESKDFLDAVFHSVQDGISVLNTDLSIRYVNPVMENWYQASFPLIGKKCYAAYHDTQVPCNNCPSLRCMKSGQTEMSVVKGYPEDGSKVQWIELFSYPLKEKETGKINGVIEFVRDITDREVMRQQLLEERQLLSQILETAPIGIVKVGADGQIIFANEEAKRINGLDSNEYNNRTYNSADWSITDLDGNPFPDEGLPFSLVQRTGKSVIDVRHAVEKPDGQRILLSINATPVFNEQGDFEGMVASLIDITDKIGTEKKLEQSIKEKDYLMQELNHRVKNNLAMVSSLVSLKDAEIQDDLSDIKYQIEAIRIIHEKLYQTENVDQIFIREYVQELLENIFASFTDYPVQIINKIENINISTKIAIPLGLIINEVATNAIKYGFTKDSEARFTVKMWKNTNNSQYKIYLSNTGNPFPEDIDIQDLETLGLKLIHSLVEQLNGSIELSRNPCPEFFITLPIGP